MTKLTKPLSLFLIAITIIGGAGWWWFRVAPLSSEFVSIIPDQAYLDWEDAQLPETDTNHDRITDTLLAKAASATGTLPVLISLSYDRLAQSAVQQSSELLADQRYKFYPSANVISAAADLNQLQRLALIDGVVMIEEDIQVVGLSRALSIAAVGPSLPLSTAAVAVIDGGTTYNVIYRQALVEAAGAGLNHGNVVAGNLLRVNPSSKIIDVTVLDAEAKAPVSRLIEGVDWAIQSKEKLNISSLNVSTGYVGRANFAFNRALSVAAAEDLAVVVSVAAESNAGEVAAKVPGVVRVGYYTEGQSVPSVYTKEQVDVLAPTDETAGASAAAAKVSGVVSRLITQTGDDANWWGVLSTTVSSINDIITITDDQLSDISTGNEAAMLQFMQSLGEYLQGTIDQLKANLGDSKDDQLLKRLLDTTAQLLHQFPYSTDSAAWEDSTSSDLNDLLSNLLGDINEDLQ